MSDNEKVLLKENLDRIRQLAGLGLAGLVEDEEEVTEENEEELSEENEEVTEEDEENLSEYDHIQTPGGGDIAEDEEAIRAFISASKTINGMLDEMRGHVDDHFGLQPREVNFSHVEYLKQIIRTLTSCNGKVKGFSNIETHSPQATGSAPGGRERDPSGGFVL